MKQQQEKDHQILKRKNIRLLHILLCVMAGMLGLAYASVPLYDLFCKATGFGGTTQISDNLPQRVLERAVTVNFDTNVATNLQWEFKPEQRTRIIKLGEKVLVNFIAVNRASTPVSGTAIYNVTPLKTGKYFNKIQCFCFNEQVLNPNEKINMPVMFYIDPKMNDDPLMDDVTTITLSYTFFKIGTPELDKAWEAFYNSDASNVNAAP